MTSYEALRFDGRVAVVTGAGRGIGKEIALHLGARGAAVMVNDIGIAKDAQRYTWSDMPAGSPLASYHAEAEDPDVAAKVSGIIARGGGRSAYDTGDVGDPNAATTLVERTVDLFGGLDMVINNAGILIHSKFADLSWADFVSSISVHAGGVFNVTRAAWPHLEASDSACVLNVGSVAGVLVGVPGHAVYDAAKGASAGLTMSLAAEGRASRIRVNALFPSADTRCSASVSRDYKRLPGLTTAAVAPVAGWLVHEACETSGEMYFCGGGRVARVFSAIADGYQAGANEELSLELVRTRWPEAQKTEPWFQPADAKDLAARGRLLYEQSQHR